jgi:hypothetical protein
MTHEDFVELELKGSTDVAVAFVEGFRLGTPEAEKVWYSHWEPIRPASWFAALREKIGTQVRVVLPPSMADRIQEAIALTDRLKLEVGNRHRLRGAEFSFEFRCYSRDAGGEIRRLIEHNLPEGVSLSDYAVDEKEDPGAHGAEMYAPAHEYILSGSGAYRGRVPGVLEMIHRLSDQSFIHSGNASLLRET